MNSDNTYSSYCYQDEPEYHYFNSDVVQENEANRNANIGSNRAVSDVDVNNSVKKIKDAVKEKTDKIKHKSNQGACSSSANVERTNSDAFFTNGSNRIARSIREKLESAYQNSKNSDLKREEVAKELGLPIKKVNNWFQNRKAKDRRENPDKFEATRKYVHSGKFCRKHENLNNDCSDENLSDKNMKSVADGCNNENKSDKNVKRVVDGCNNENKSDKNVKRVADGCNNENKSDKNVKPSTNPLYKPNYIRLRASSPKPFNESIDNNPRKSMRYNSESGLPYWPSFEWNSIDKIPLNEENRAKNQEDNDNTVYETFTDEETGKTYTVL